MRLLNNAMKSTFFKNVVFICLLSNAIKPTNVGFIALPGFPGFPGFRGLTRKVKNPNLFKTWSYEFKKKGGQVCFPAGNLLILFYKQAILKTHKGERMVIYGKVRFRRFFSGNSDCVVRFVRARSG